jgi:hypothetical protein
MVKSLSTTKSGGAQTLALIAAGFATLLTSGLAKAEAPKGQPSWDRIGNIKEMAQHIGNVQRNQGAEKAMGFIDACYRTHSLSSAYSKPFEGCIAADYMLARALVAVIERVPPGELQKSGLAPPAEILKAAQTRIGSGFGQYGINATDAQAFLGLVDQHGMPTFMQAVFPKKN